MSQITSVHAREIVDSRGNPTIEVDVHLSTGAFGRAAVPSGASTGAHEASELRDGDAKRYLGKGVTRAVQNVRGPIAKALNGREGTDQVAIDQLMLELDGTEQKSKLGANAILGVSLAVAKAAAEESGLPLFRYVGGTQATRLPVPLMNVLNGGAHADNGLDVQEFMIAPIKGGSFSEALRMGTEIFHTLKKILSNKGLSTAVGDEGGFAPRLQNNREALTLLLSAIEKAGYRPGEDVVLALDVAATEFYEGGSYKWESSQLSAEALGEVYTKWCTEFPLASIEDGFSEDDWVAWTSFQSKVAARQHAVQTVGDDLFVTNPKRVQKGIDLNAANALLVKVNQIGTLTETARAVDLARTHQMRAVMSHRSGETEDSTIADLAVALGCAQIKTGSLCRGERTAKYNQLLRIEESLGSAATFWGAKAFRHL